MHLHLKHKETERVIIRQTSDALDFCIIISRMNVHKGDDEDISRV